MRWGARVRLRSLVECSHSMPHNNRQPCSPINNNNNNNSSNNTTTTTHTRATRVATALAAPPSWAASRTAAPPVASASCACAKPVASSPRAPRTGCVWCATSKCKSPPLCLCLTVPVSFCVLSGWLSLEHLHCLSVTLKHPTHAHEN